MLNTIIAIIILSFLLILAILNVFFMLCLFWASFFTKVPFVPIRKALLPEVAKALELDENSKLYDMGCGDARVLLACYKIEPRARYIGIEKDLIPWIWAGLKLRRVRQPHNIEVKRKNFFKQDISDATHIFTYLLPGMMDALLPKFQAELRPGARLVACDFPFSQKAPVKIIEFDRPVKSLGKRLLIYRF